MCNIALLHTASTWQVVAKSAGKDFRDGAVVPFE
jgi:hypothetical protein